MLEDDSVNFSSIQTYYQSKKNSRIKAQNIYGTPPITTPLLQPIGSIFSSLYMNRSKKIGTGVEDIYALNKPNYNCLVSLQYLDINLPWFK